MNEHINIDSFNKFELPSNLLDNLTQLNYTTPTPIQAATIPLALAKHDVLGTAQTGTGKTLAFVIPLIANIINNPNQVGLVLTPTRELAEQIVNTIKKILHQNFNHLKVALLIGGEPIFKQLKLLKLKPKIIVGTPGRVIDHLNKGSLAPKCNLIVLDETDRMFDMGFGIQLETIMQQLPKQRQTLMFSATMPKYIQKLANNYLITPKVITIAPSENFKEKLTEKTIKVKRTQKFNTLLEQISTRTGTIIIFVRTKHGAENLSKDLHNKNYKVSYIHGDLKQSQRCKVMNAFRKGSYQIMVATDLAARGLDVPHIQHVINYDIPNCSEDYIHRVGRTARAGAEGYALNLICTDEQGKWNLIQKHINNKNNHDNESNDNNNYNKIKRFPPTKMIANSKKTTKTPTKFKKFRKSQYAIKSKI